MEKDNPSELLYMCRMGDAHAQYRLFAQYEGLLTSLVNLSNTMEKSKFYKDEHLEETTTSEEDDEPMHISQVLIMGAFTI